MHGHVGTASLQTHGAGVQVSFSDLRLQAVDHLHREVEDAKLGLGLVTLLGLQHHADPAKLVQGVVDVSYPHPLPSIVGESSVLGFLRVIIIITTGTQPAAHVAHAAGVVGTVGCSLLPLGSSLASSRSRVAAGHVSAQCRVTATAGAHSPSARRQWFRGVGRHGAHRHLISFAFLATSCWSRACAVVDERRRSSRRMISRSQGLMMMILRKVWSSVMGLGRNGSVTLHDVESIIKQLSIRLRLESVIVDHCCCCWVITLLTGWRRPDIVVSGPRVQGGGVGHAVGGADGAGLVVHAVRHEVAGVVARILTTLPRELQGLGARVARAAPVLVVELTIVDSSLSLASHMSLTRSSDLVETVLKHLVQMHRILAPSHWIHLLTQ